MEFPRIKEFEFDIEKTYEVPTHLVGRLHKIAYELFGEVKFYKPLAAANGIKLSHGLRPGIRTVEDALRLELKNDGYTDEQIDPIVFEKMSEKRLSDLDWNNYYDVSYGYVSDVTEGLLLAVPTFQSAVLYLDTYEIIKGSS